MALTKVTFSMIDGPTINVKDYGIIPSASASDNLTNLNALIASAPVGATLLFPPGTYNMSTFIAVLRSNIRLLGGPGVTINNTNLALGYPGDGIRVGNAAAVEGEEGTNTIPYTFTTNVIVDGFIFTNCRIGLWFVYCSTFIAQNIQANSTATVACGNDAYDDCDNFLLSNISQIGWDLAPGGTIFYCIGIYRSNTFNIEGVSQRAGMTNTPQASVIDINDSTQFSLKNAHLNNVSDISNGITLAGCTNFSVSDCTVRNAKSGFVTFPRNSVTEMVGTISNCAAISCTNGIEVYASYTTFENIYTSSCTYDLALQTDASLNYFQDCKFNPTGTASVYQEIPTGNNGINLQRWRNNAGIIMGTANGYFGGLSTSFRAAQSTGASNVTGDGTAYVVTTWTTEFEFNNGTTMFNSATGIFTAPITGLYRFEMAVSLSDAATSAFTSSQLALTLSGSTLSIIIDKQFGANNVLLNGSALVAINRGVTARLTVTASGGSLTADIPANAALTYWSGMLVA
jgi:hypothetical protein